MFILTYYFEQILCTKCTGFPQKELYSYLKLKKKINTWRFLHSLKSFIDQFQTTLIHCNLYKYKCYKYINFFYIQMQFKVFFFTAYKHKNRNTTTLNSDLKPV